MIWDWQDWLSGKVTIADGSKLESIDGSAKAWLRAEKAIGSGGFKLKSGGSPEILFKGSTPESFGGHLNFGYQDWVDGTVSVDEGSTLASISGEASAQILVEKPIGGSGFKVRAGTRANARVENSDFDSFSGQLRWGYQDWVEGTISVEKSKLDSISGQATAKVVADKPLGPKLTLKPNNNTNIQIDRKSVV